MRFIDKATGMEVQINSQVGMDAWNRMEEEEKREGRHRRNLIVNAVRIKYTLQLYEFNFELVHILNEWEEEGDLTDKQWANLEHYINEALGLDQ